MVIHIRFPFQSFQPSWITFNKIKSRVTLIMILYVSDEDNSDKTICQKWHMVILSHCDKYTKWYTKNNGTELVERKLNFF